MSGRNIIKKAEGSDNLLVIPGRQSFQARQIDLFQNFLVNSDYQKIPLSNTIELWDVLPKYAVSPAQQDKMRTKEGLLPLLEREVSFFGNEYAIYIKPALLSDEKGRAYYPSNSEELIEDCLRKIATVQDQCFFDQGHSHCGVKFTLHQLRLELKNQGHARSYQQVLKSLTILAGADIEIRMKNRKAVSFDKYLSLAGFSRETRLDNPDSMWVAYFHPLVYQAMANVDYRQFNYQLMMALKPQLARWLYKRLAHYYTNAGLLSPLRMTLLDIQRESGMLTRIRTGNAVIELEEIFQALINENVFKNYEKIKDIRGPKNKIVDVEYLVSPHPEFIKSVKAANRRQADDKLKIASPIIATQ